MLMYSGVNLDRNGTAVLSGIADRWNYNLIRLPLTKDIDLLDYFRWANLCGLTIIAILDRTSLEQGWNGESREQKCRHYVERYERYVKYWQRGNEPDIESIASWTETPEEVNAWSRAFRRVAPNVQLISPGLASGNPLYCRDLDLSLFNALAWHPYAKKATPNWPADWGEYVGDKYAEYAAYGLPQFFTEWGYPAADYSVGELSQAKYYSKFLDTCRQIGVSCTVSFGYDTYVDNLSLLRGDGTAKPALERSGSFNRFWRVSMEHEFSGEGVRNLASKLGLSYVGEPRSRELYFRAQNALGPNDEIMVQFTSNGIFLYNKADGQTHFLETKRG